jgi:hypothetical protein
MKTTYSVMARWNVKLGRKKTDITLCQWTTLNGDYISQEAARKVAEQYLPYAKIIKKTWEVVEDLETA